MSLSVIRKTFQPAAAYDGDSTITTGEGWVTLVEALDTELDAGHRYLILAQILVTHQSTTNSNAVRLAVGGVADTYQDFAIGGSSDSRQQLQLCCVRTPGVGESIKIETSALGGDVYVFRAELLLVDLDTGDLSGTDLITDADTGAVLNAATSFGGAVDTGAEVTFTPDGVSDYLVFCGAAFERTNLDATLAEYGVRLQDVTNAATLCSATDIDAALDKPHDQAYGSALLRVLDAPAAASLNLALQYYGSDRWNHIETNIVVLRLNRLTSYAYGQSDVADIAHPQYMPPNVSADPARHVVPYTPDALGEAVMLSFAEHSDLDDGEIFCHQIRFGDSPTGTVASTPEWPTYGDDALDDNDGARLARPIAASTMPMVAIGLLTGLPVAEENVNFYIGRVANGPGTLKTTLAVFGTEINVPIISVDSAAAVDSTTIRITFGQPMQNDSRLLSLANYAITPADPSAATVGLQSIVAENVTQPTWVEITCTEMTDGGNYGLDVSTNETTGPRDATDTPLTAGSASASFTGIGVAPEILRTEAIGPNRIDVVFNELMADTPEIRDSSKYTFDNGLSVVGVLDVVGETVKLVTDDQTPGTVYTLTITQ